MPEAIATFDQRLTDIAALMTDRPAILDPGFETLRGALTETPARLDLMDRTIAKLTGDLRDLRAVVTRQLLRQDVNLRTIAA